ncbi:uncharacterized protein LOC101856185 [Aplysia californica]|uniref:Uncharacterized protein LOC101856185 n=1 Tax=Aplysia californica TaxID=6500 RepID=A0ABM0JRD8_APLCA|nr:uncharacterized protein LOC101856185 [Aplysia californica]
MNSVAQAVLLTTVTSLVFIPVTSMPGCARQPGAEQTYLFMCLYEHGFTDFDTVSLSSISWHRMCGNQWALVQAATCQLRYIRKCSPSSALLAPSTDPDGLPAYIRGLCETKGFNNSCFDTLKKELTVCSRAYVQRQVEVGQVKDICQTMVDQGGVCAREVLRPCGDLTVDTVVKHIPNSLPAKCVKQLRHQLPSLL